MFKAHVEGHSRKGKVNISGWRSSPCWGEVPEEGRKDGKQISGEDSGPPREEVGCR